MYTSVQFIVVLLVFFGLSDCSINNGNRRGRANFPALRTPPSPLPTKKNPTKKPCIFF